MINTNIVMWIGLLLLSYLYGSINNGIIIGKIFHKTDIREHGSKGAGSTNTLRTFGAKTAAVVMILDVLKPIIPVLIARLFLDTEQLFVGWDLLIAFAAVSGQCFPIFFGFRGGKGAASTLGTMILFFPLITVGATITFLLVVYFTRFVSLATLLGIGFTAIMVAIYHPAQLLPFMAIVVLVYLRHASNIQRLLHGTENKLGQKSNS